MITNEESKTIVHENCKWLSYFETQDRVELCFLNTKNKEQFTVTLRNGNERTIQISANIKFTPFLPLSTMDLSGTKSYTEKSNDPLVNKIVYKIVKLLKEKPEFRLSFLTGRKEIHYGKGIDENMQRCFLRLEDPNFLTTHRDLILSIFQEAISIPKPTEIQTNVSWTCHLHNVDNDLVKKWLCDQGVIKEESQWSQAIFFGVNLSKNGEALRFLQQKLNALGIIFKMKTNQKKLLSDYFKHPDYAHETWLGKPKITF